MFGTWRAIGIAAAACLVLGIGFGSLFFGPGPKLIELNSDGPGLVPPTPCRFPASVDGPACQGRGTSLTVLVPGHLGCAVRVGGVDAGRAPMFRAPVPTGRCSIVVQCGAKRYCETAMLRASVHRVLEIDASMWNGPEAGD